MTLSDFIAKYLYENNIDTIFEMIGGMSVRLIDAIYRHGKIQIISTHHEQGAALAACGWAKVTGRPGVAIATSGPGATNLITGIATSYFDSIPTIFITGQVNQNELSTGKIIRQLGFQETDIVSIVKPITKYATQLTKAGDIFEVLPMAFQIANTGRKGPVLIDIPMNLQKEPINFSQPLSCNISNADNSFDCLNTIHKINSEIKLASRPLFLVGGGVAQSRTTKLMQKVITKSRIPAVYSLHGKEVLNAASQLTVGLIGTYGNRWANIAISEADLLIVLGSRLDVRQTGADTAQFQKDKRIIHLDIDTGELNNRICSDIQLLCDLKSFLPNLAENIIQANCNEWLDIITKNRIKYPDDQEQRFIKNINPNYFLKRLGELKQEYIAGYVTDVGANQIWAAQSIPIFKDQFFLTSGSMGAMGYGLPVSIGAALAKTNNKSIVSISGDGGFQCNIQELELVSRLALPIKIIILNNHSLGMVRQFQGEICDGRYPGTVLTYSAPDFVKVTSGYGIHCLSISSAEEIENAINWLFSSSSPSLLEVNIDTDAGVYPKMQFGHNLNDMYPYTNIDLA